MVEQGSTLILVCRVVGVPSTTVLSYQWTCPGGYCDAGAVDPEWAARIQQGNILVVNVRTQDDDNGIYTCTVVDRDSTQQVGIARYTLSVASECHCIKECWILYNHLVGVLHSPGHHSTTDNATVLLRVSSKTTVSSRRIGCVRLSL